MAANPIYQFFYLPGYIEDIFLDALAPWISPMMVFGVMLPIAVLQLILMIAAVLNLMKKPVRSNDKIPWLLLILLVNLIGPIVYFAVGSGKLDDKAAQYEDGRFHTQ